MGGISFDSTLGIRLFHAGGLKREDQPIESFLDRDPVRARKEINANGLMFGPCVDSDMRLGDDYHACQTVGRESVEAALDDRRSRLQNRVAHNLI